MTATATTTRLAHRTRRAVLEQVAATLFARHEAGFVLPWCRRGWEKATEPERRAWLVVAALPVTR